MCLIETRVMIYLKELEYNNIYPTQISKSGDKKIADKSTVFEFKEATPGRWAPV